MIDDLLLYVRENERVCPMPDAWNRLWKMLPRRRDSEGEWVPSLPLILGAWAHTSDVEKRNRLLEHIQSAADHGLLSDVDQFLRAIPEDQWLHSSEV
jgi:hypothetical protein